MSIDHIDDALREYVARTPPLGMEARILRRVQAEPARQRWLGWMVPGLVVAGLGLAIWIRPVHSRAIARTPGGGIGGRLESWKFNDENDFIDVGGLA